MAMEKNNLDFQFLTFPIGYIRGLGWRWCLKTNFIFFSKGIFVQEGPNGTRFDHGQFGIKTFPIYAPPYYIYTTNLKKTRKEKKRTSSGMLQFIIITFNN